MARPSKAGDKKTSVVEGGLELLKEGGVVDLTEAEAIAPNFVEGEDFFSAEELRDLVIQEVKLNEAKESDTSQEPSKAKRQKVEDPNAYRVKVTRTGLMIGSKVFREGDLAIVSEEIYNLSDDEQRTKYGAVFFTKS